MAAALGQHTPSGPTAQRHTGPQPRPAQPQRIGNAFLVPPTVNLASHPGQGQPIPEAVRRKMESLFNADFSNVRIHVGAQAKSIGAVAFTMGSQIRFAPGHYNPNTSHGLRLLGHELTHVVQQRSGRVRNPFGRGIAVVQDTGMEAEADRMGIQAAAHRLPVQAKTVVQPKGIEPPPLWFAGEPVPAIRGEQPFVSLAATGGRPPVDLHTAQPHPISHSSEGIIQPRRKRWTHAQREQSRKFWEKKREKEERKRKAEEARLLRTMRSSLAEIAPSDERFFQDYRKSSKPAVTVYRGAGWGITATSLDNYAGPGDIQPKAGTPDRTFYGVVNHQWSNRNHGCMVSCTAKICLGVHFAVDSHNYGLVYEIEIDDYIDVNWLLKKRNFRNRYLGQHEFLIPRAIRATEIRRVYLVSKETGIIKVWPQFKSKAHRKRAQRGWKQWVDTQGVCNDD